MPRSFLVSRSRLLAAFVLLALLVSVRPAVAGTRALLTRSIDDASLVSLNGNTRAAALNPAFDRGPVDDTLALDHMLLVLKRPPEKQVELDREIDALHDPASAQFHHWLTAAEYGKRFGMNAGDLATIKQWLEMHGLTVNHVYPNGLIIDFSGDAASVREAFHTELHALEVNGEQHIANIRDPQVPAALAPAVEGIVSLHDFRPHALYRELTRAHFDATSTNLVLTPAREERAGGSGAGFGAEYTFAAGSSTYQAVVPGDLATIYNLNALFAAGLSGQGQTVAVIEDTDVYAPDDWRKFRAAFGLSRYTGGSFTQVHPGNCADPHVNANDGEAILDAEYASAAAPSAAIVLASCADTRTTFGGLLALANLINGAKPPTIVSLSYGECEAENGAAANAAYAATYQQAVAEGVSVFVASGDEGGAGCDAGAASATHGTGVNAFASTAYNVAVGGTDFGDTAQGTNAKYWAAADSATYASAKSYINEIPWNDSCASALIATAATGSAVSYGAKGFCNSSVGDEYYLSTSSGSGGPSSCFSGAAGVLGVTSGSCKGAPKPTWQSGLPGLPADGVRDLPDVSLFAANGIWGHYFIYCYSDAAHGGTPCTGAPYTWAGAGGTSFAAPILAAVQALVNQKAGGPQGNPNPVYYALAAAEYGKAGSSSCNSSKGSAAGAGCVFYDVTQGDIDVNCTGTYKCYRPSGTNGVLSTSNTAYQPAYPATVGYDVATGIGSVNAYNLVNNWRAATTVKAHIVRRIRPIFAE